MKTLPIRKAGLRGLSQMICFSVVLALSGAVASHAESKAAAPSSSKYVPEGYQLAFYDEFDGNALDTVKWQFRTDKKMGSEQKESNVSVSDGKLILRLTHDPENNDPKRPYSGSGVISRATFVYGYYEARFKIPKARGWHTSFWLQGYDQEGTGTSSAVQEIDICENDSLNPHTYSTNLHKWSPPKKTFGAVYPKEKLPDLSEDFHIWGCEFTPTAIHCYFDGKLVKTYDPAPLGEPNQHNIWLTSICTLTPSKMKPEEHPATAEFDYVRFYKKQ